MTKAKTNPDKFFKTTTTDVKLKETTPSKWRWLWAILVVLAGVIFIYFMWSWLRPDQAGATDLCEAGKYCADWHFTHCDDYDYRICHINPAQNVQHNFQNYNSCNNHLGTPHNSETYDLAGLCPAPSPTPTVTPTPTLTPTPTMTPTPTPPVCDEQTYTCGECSEKPNDDWCGEYKYGYCKENYSCGYTDDVWACECPAEPTPTPTPAPTGAPRVDTFTSSTPPQCTATNPEKAPCNFHLYRNGDQAVLRWEACGANAGDKVAIYYKQNSSADWQYSVIADNNGLFTVNGLDSMDITFAMQQLNSCAGGGLASPMTEPVIDGSLGTWVLYR